MNNRKQKIEELMEGIRTLKRHMVFRSTCSQKMPRITPSQWGALMTIDCRGECAVKDVAEALGITSSAATQLVDGLVKSGYVIRKTQAEDRRAVTLTLSPKTKEEVAAMKKESREKFLKLFEVLSDKELDQFISLHKKITDNIISNKNKNI